VSTEIIHDALSYLSDDLITAVDVLRQKRAKARHNAIRYGTIAACLCVLLCGALLWPIVGMRAGSAAPEPAAGASGGAAPGNLAGMGGVYIPEAELNLGSDPNAGGAMVHFFIYDGRSYMQYETMGRETGLWGEALGEVSGPVDGWRPGDGYVNFAGNVRGTIHEVRGYDPAFMLAVEEPDGTVSTYINNNGYALTMGYELYEDRLCLPGNYTEIEYSVEDDTFILPPEHMELAARFVDALCAAPFMQMQDVPLGEGEYSLRDKLLCGVYFHMDNGMTTHLTLFDGGYVRFGGVPSVCVRVDGDIFQELTGVLAIND